MCDNCCSFFKCCCKEDAKKNNSGSIQSDDSAVQTNTGSSYKNVFRNSSKPQSINAAQAREVGLYSIGGVQHPPQNHSPPAVSPNHKYSISS